MENLVFYVIMNDGAEKLQSHGHNKKGTRHIQYEICLRPHTL